MCAVYACACALLLSRSSAHLHAHALPSPHLHDAIVVHPHVYTHILQDEYAPSTICFYISVLLVVLWSSSRSRWGYMWIQHFVHMPQIHSKRPCLWPTTQRQAMTVASTWTRAAVRGRHRASVRTIPPGWWGLQYESYSILFMYFRWAIVAARASRVRAVIVRGNYVPRSPKATTHQPHQARRAPN
jgi:hypothetical protein